MNIQIVGLGAMNLDRIYRVERLLLDGEAAIEEFALSPGGSAANTIYALAKLGIKAGFLGAVGADPDGQRLIQDLVRVGVDISQIKVKHQVPTGTVLCLSDRKGRRSLYVQPGANSLLEEKDLDLAYLNKAEILHLSAFVHPQQRALQIKVVEKLPPRVKISFAPGALYSSLGFGSLSPILRRTFVLFLNREELKDLTGEDIQKGVEVCHKEGCRIVAVTLGKGVRKRGSKALLSAYVSDGKKEAWIERPLEKSGSVADTIGAGDAFAAGFLYGLLKGRDLEDCGVLGDLVARLSLSQVGARAGLPTLPQLSERYRLERVREL